ncbi:MAG: leucine-rich repeat protein [Treponema sp.]
MKKLIYVVFIALLAFSCKHNQNPKTNGDKNDEAIDKWVKVRYNNLGSYLSYEASNSEINYIWVTEMVAQNLNGGTSGISPSSSELGDILKNESNKNVALKFDERIEGLKEMKAAFVGCKNLVAVENIPIGVENLEMCFAGCALLEEVKNIPNTVKSLKNCFNTCVSLKKAPIISIGVEDMSHCFMMCKELEVAPILPTTVTNLEECFLGCKKLKKAPRIPENVTNLATTFMMTSLEEMPEIPSKVENMKFCFAACKALTKTKRIPKSVKDMRNTFLSCTKITSIDLDCEYNNEKGGINDREGYFFENTFTECSGLGEKSISVPNEYLENYSTHASNMGVPASRFVGR